MATATKNKELAPVTINQGRADFFILGITPLIYNAVSFHSQTQLLKPKGRKTTAEKATQLKHVPLDEYQDSTYRRRKDELGPTRLLLPCRMFKAAVADVAKRIGDSSKSEMQQLVWVEGDYTDLFGIPQIYMTVVRNSDIARTPDIRTRAIVTQWCCKISIHHVIPNISSNALGSLLSAAGILNGVGDYRQQKGAGNYGQFKLVNANDKQVATLMKNAGIKAQDKSLLDPIPYDQETVAMLSWYNGEIDKMDLPQAAE